MMKQITLGRTKETVSAVSLGTWAFGGESIVGELTGTVINLIGGAAK